MEQKTTKELIIKGLNNWVKNHKDQDLPLAYSSVVELLDFINEQEETINKLLYQIGKQAGMYSMDEGITNVRFPEKCECCPHLFEYKCRAEKCPYDQTTDNDRSE